MFDNLGTRAVVHAVSAALLLGVLTVSGCSQTARPKVVPVSGSVKVKGVAVADASVTFSPEGKSPRSPNGVTDSQGNFKLTTYDTNDGAMVGDFAVTIVSTKSASGGKKPEEMTAQDMINMGPRAATKTDGMVPSKYGDKKTSGLKRSVVEGDQNVFNFDLTD